jgi:hypothetical protein
MDEVSANSVRYGVQHICQKIVQTLTARQAAQAIRKDGSRIFG